MLQNDRGFKEWSQLVMEQVNRGDWSIYDEADAAREAILFQMEFKKPTWKVLAEDTTLRKVIKPGVVNIQATKLAERLKSKTEHEAFKSRIKAQVHAFIKSLAQWLQGSLRSPQARPAPVGPWKRQVQGGSHQVSSNTGRGKRVTLSKGRQIVRSTP